LRGRRRLQHAVDLRDDSCDDPHHRDRDRHDADEPSAPADDHQADPAADDHRADRLFLGRPDFDRSLD
jgi:hypothetical protein